jgi:hypothetical protein
MDQRQNASAKKSPANEIATYSPFQLTKKAGRTSTKRGSISLFRVISRVSRAQGVFRFIPPAKVVAIDAGPKTAICGANQINRLRFFHLTTTAQRGNWPPYAN